MAVKISLSLELEEFSTLDSDGKDYYCRVTVMWNGVKQEHVYHSSIEALEAGMRVAADWKHAFRKLKNATLKRQKSCLKLVKS